MTGNAKQVVYAPGDVAPVMFDPEIAAALEIFHRFQGPGAFTMDSIPAIRQGLADVIVPDPRLADVEAFTTREIQAPGMPGDPDVSLLVCQPSGAEGATATLFYTHGGGMVIGDNRMGLGEMIDYAVELNLTIVSVEYRLAPEHPHPAPVNDCYAGLLWAVQNASDLGIDPSRIIVAGSSAGGGLAAALSLLARDRGGADLLGQMLICPMLDDRNDTISAQQIVAVGTWDRNSNETGWSALLGEKKGSAEVSPYAAPARAGDLSGLPPAFIDVGSAETFRDEAVAYATSIWQAGGTAELHVWPGGCHGFDIVAPGADISLKARAARLSWLRRMVS